MAKEQAHHKGELCHRPINLNVHELGWIEGAGVVTGEACCPVGTSNTIFNTVVINVTRIRGVAGDRGIVILHHGDGVIV